MSESDAFVVCEVADGVNQTVSLPNARYTSVDSLIATWQKFFKHKLSHVNIMYNPQIGICAMVMEQRCKYIRMVFSRKFASLCGFIPHGYLDSTFTVTKPDSETAAYVQSVRSPNINNGFYSLYVYSDLVQPSIVGDSKSNLLRVVPTPDLTEHRQVMHECRILHYKPLTVGLGDEIEVDIRDDTGAPVLFDDSPVSVTIHIRPIKPTK